MEMDKMKKYILDNKIIDHEGISDKSARNITKIVSELEKSGKVDISDAQTLTQVLARTVSETIAITLEECIPALSAAMCSQMKEEIKKEVLDETKAHLHMQSGIIKHAVTNKLVKARYDVDKREAYDRRSNLTFSGIEDDIREKRNSRLTRDKLVDILKGLGCRINREDISACHRIYRRNTTNTAPNIIICRFVSRQVRDEVEGFSHTFATSGRGRYINEDMTQLQRNLFYFLRQKEDIVIKKTVGFKDGNVICLLKKNADDKKWSRIETAFDLAALDNDLALDINNKVLMKSLGLEDCVLDLNLE